MRVTLHEVAARADVSIATVSRALNGLPVSADSLERVRQAAAELGYVANEAARSLRTDRTLTLGMVFFDLANTRGIELVDALSEAVEAEGYSLLISTARGDPARYDLLMRRFLERRVDGLFCFRPDGAGASLAAFRAAGIPLMTIFANPGPYESAPSVRPRFRAASGDLARRLAELGHRSVLLLRTAYEARVFDTIARAAEARGIAARKVPAPADDLSAVTAAIAAGEASAVVAADGQASELVLALARNGFSIPGDVSVIGLSDTSAESRRRNRAISTLMIDPYRTGQATARTMLRWLAGEPPNGEVSVETASFEDRGSVGPARR